MSLPNEPRPSYSPPHGGACEHCGVTRPDVFVDSEGVNTCPDCDRFDLARRDEFRTEKLSRHQQRKHNR